MTPQLNTTTLSHRETMTTQITESFRSGMSLFTSRAIDRLKTGKEGDTIDRSEMQKVVGRDCSPTGKGYGSVQAAIKKVERENGIVWRWSKTQGVWLCLNDSQKVGEVGRYKAKATRIVRRGIRVGSTVDAAKLTQAELKEFSITTAQMSVLEMAGRADTSKKLGDAAEVKQPKLEDLMKLMK